MIQSVLARINSDYFMRSRLDEYAKLLEYILNNSYEIITVIDYFHRIKNGQIKSTDRIIINRHDIDTDIQTAKRMFEVERKLGVRASYYFRLKTLDIQLMKEINAYGSEASYHFEEIASYAKKNGLKEKNEVYEHIEFIRREFKNNFFSIEKQLGYKLRSVASHGDFANRALGVANHLITESKILRKELGIEAETYDDSLFSSFDIYLSDRVPPVKFVPVTPEEAIRNGHRIICILTHPRQWYASWVANTGENLNRLAEGMKW